MQILVKGNQIIVYAPSISFGVYDEDFEKWKLEDENGNIMYYMIDDGFTLIENVTLPSDYAEGKYFFENGEFVLNENWKPYISPEERLNNVEIAVATQEESVMLFEEELLNTQIALTEQYETNIILEEELLGTQLALTEQYETNLALEEELLSTQLALTEMYEMLLMLTEG